MKFTGTIASFNKMVKNLDLCPYKNNYQFLNKKFNQCVIFQGIVKAHGIIYQKGDYYMFEVKK